MFSSKALSLAAEVIRAAEEAEVMVATAESCTGGLVAAAITSISGAATVLDRGFVTYSNEAKIEMLGVPVVDLQDYGAVSEPIALAMARGAIANSHARASVSITGIAGPTGGSEAKPVGLVHFAAVGPDGEITHVEKRYGNIGRGEVRAESMIQALTMLRDALRL